METLSQSLKKSLGNLQKKLDKMSINDWQTVEKVQQKLEQGISFEWYSLKFWKKKLEEYPRKLRENFKIIEKLFKKLW